MALAINVTRASLSAKLAIAITIVGACVVLFCLALVVRTYMPCPFWDEWVVIRDIAAGKDPRSWQWLWPLQNEHRPVIPRLLTWMDLYLFGGRNVLLFIAIFVTHLFNLLAICWVIQRHSEYPTSLKRSMQGLFAFALFHPNQAENFTWAFQIQFVLPFAVATGALILVAFLGRWQHSSIAVVLVGAAPMLGAISFAGGLLIGPITLALAFAKRLSSRYMAWLTATSLMSAAVYLHHYQRVGTDWGAAALLSHAKDVAVYVLTYLGASWTRILPHKERLIAFLSLIVYTVVLIRQLRNYRKTSDLEWFLLAECTLMLAMGFLAAFGRIQFGVGQAFAGRYQTPAMIYWAALGAIVLIRLKSRWPNKFFYAQVFLLLTMLASAAALPNFWQTESERARALNAACNRVMASHFDPQDARKLYETSEVVIEARPFLYCIWNR